jgi:hypothetical protein
MNTLLNSRLYRDIRNDLSKSFFHALRTGDRQPMHEMFARYESPDLDPFYREYILNRKNKYEAALKEIAAKISRPTVRSRL